MVTNHCILQSEPCQLRLYDDPKSSFRRCVVSTAVLIATETVNTASTRNTSIDNFLSNDGGAHCL